MRDHRWWAAFLFVLIGVIIYGAWLIYKRHVRKSTR
jgi:hypothetical protein